MTTRHASRASADGLDIHTAHADGAPTCLIPATQWEDHHPWPPIGGLRHLIHHAAPRKNSRGEIIPGNGYASAFVRVGRRVLVDEAEFFRIARGKGG